MANTASSILKKAIEDAGYRAIEMKHLPLESDEKTVKSFETMSKLLVDRNNVLYTVNPDIVWFYAGCQTYNREKNYKKGQIVPVYDDRERYLMLNRGFYFIPPCDPIDETMLKRYLQSLKEGDCKSCVVCFDTIKSDNIGISCNTCLNELCNKCVSNMNPSSPSFACPVCRQGFGLMVKRTPNV